MQNSPLFNDNHRHHFLMRRKARLSQFDFLYRWAAREIESRLDDITRDFSSVLICGAQSQECFEHRFPDAVVMQDAAPENFSLYAGQFDLILSLGGMHCANDLPGLLIQMRRALKPDGVMMAAFAGGETLIQLRSALMHGEITVLGGASPRVYPMTDSQHMAGLMQRAGFALPVTDTETLSVSYRDMFHLMDDVRGMGESNALLGRYKKITPPRVFAEAARYYQDHFPDAEGQRIEARFDIVFLIGWAPHSSQQKPAKRGSGQISMTEIL